jgi:hypothetical protein
MKLLLALGAGLLAFFFRAFVGDGYWDGAILLAVLLFGPIGFVSGRWSAALLGCTLLPAAFLADALYRPGAGLDSILAAPVALFLTPFAILLLLAGAGVRKLVQSRFIREGISTSLQ